MAIRMRISGVLWHWKYSVLSRQEGLMIFLAKAQLRTWRRSQHTHLTDGGVRILRESSHYLGSEPSSSTSTTMRHATEIWGTRALIPQLQKEVLRGSAALRCILMVLAISRRAGIPAVVVFPRPQASLAAAVPSVQDTFRCASFVFEQMPQPWSSVL
eukprot:5340371-Pyramimonas_sp.AAC.1